MMTPKHSLQERIKDILKNQQGTGEDCQVRMSLDLALAEIMKEMRGCVPERRRVSFYPSTIQTIQKSWNSCRQAMLKAINGGEE